jgi:signal transduction histidine kinase/CheY-like chemotaxis protein
MRIRTLIYYITTGFVIGIVTLIAAQYITSKNIRELITGNENLLQEYKLSNELVGLQKDLLLLDNKIKTAVITGDSHRIRDFESGVQKVKEDVKALQHVSDSNSSPAYMNDLNRLVRQKLDFSHQLVDSFYKAGKPAAESLIATNKAIRLSEEITTLTHKIDTSGRRALAEKIKSVDRSGQRVLNWNFYIIVLVLFLLTAVFLIIVGRMKKQSQLITQLNTSEKNLKQAALVKENFLANMSHEIRTPLNAILGYTNLLQRKKLDDDARLHVATVQQSGETLLSIVNDILDLSKIESGMMRLEEVAFSLSGLIHSVARMFHQRMDEKGLLLKTSIAASLPDIFAGDSTRLTQILVNLVGNALKFTAQGEIRLDVQGKKIDDAHLELEFIISDTGIGIEADKLDTIFERFRQAEDSTTRKFGGTGLGLSIVRDLVYLQNGDIEVKSKTGAGTTVSFKIPYKVTEHQNIGVHFEEKQPDIKTDLKVLIAEDNVINQGLMVHILSDWGIKNKVVNNGREALEAIKYEHFDLVFMDIQMPEMDGYTATTEIRQILKLEIPIVAMTAHAMIGEREKCISYGMNEHISKPIREADLRRIFSIFLKSKVSTQSDIHGDVNDYKTINLGYMREISNGDLEYEKLVTAQFLNLIPRELAALSKAFADQNHPELKHIAHGMKTSISIMGLDTLLNEDLDALENDNLDENQIQTKVIHIASVCNQALAEANAFYSHF